MGPSFNEKNRSIMDKTNLSLRSIDAINTEKCSSTLINTQKNSSMERYDLSLSQIEMIESGHASWKYKNPYSISNHMRYQKYINMSENDILREDEPQEGRMKQSILFDCRDYLANYQESYGTPRTEYSFAALIIVMIQATVQSLWALIHVIVNVVSIIQMFPFILRFVLDKVISIRRTKDLQQTMVKFAILAVQLLSVYICLISIFDFIVFPIVQMAVGIAVKFITRD